VIALVMGSSILTALVLGWYGQKAYIRIQAWGEKMNEQDAILQSVSPPGRVGIDSGICDTGALPATSATIRPLAVG